MTDDKELIIKILQLIPDHAKKTGKVLSGVSFKWDKKGINLEGYTSRFKLIKK